MPGSGALMAESFSAFAVTVIVLPDPHPPRKSRFASGVSSSKNASCGVSGIGAHRITRSRLAIRVVASAEDHARLDGPAIRPFEAVAFREFLPDVRRDDRDRFQSHEGIFPAPGQPVKLARVGFAFFPAETAEPVFLRLRLRKFPPAVRIPRLPFCPRHCWYRLSVARSRRVEQERSREGARLNRDDGGPALEKEFCVPPPPASRVRRGDAECAAGGRPRQRLSHEREAVVIEDGCGNSRHPDDVPRLVPLLWFSDNAGRGAGGLVGRA